MVFATALQEDNVFSTNASLPYDPPIQKLIIVRFLCVDVSFSMHLRGNIN